MVRVERRYKHDLSFHEDEIKLAKIIMDEARTTLEFLYYLMAHKRKFSFTIILLSADYVKLESLLQKSKRETDILLEIDAENNSALILPFSTKSLRKSLLPMISIIKFPRSSREKGSK